MNDTNTGTQYRDPNIISQPKNGGAVCPSRQTQNCNVDCQYTWSVWSSCSKNGTQFRDPIVNIGDKNLGPNDPNKCPSRQTQKCTF